MQQLQTAAILEMQALLKAQKQRGEQIKKEEDETVQANNTAENNEVPCEAPSGQA
jgi:hypothetical protein